MSIYTIYIHCTAHHFRANTEHNPTYNEIQAEELQTARAVHGASAQPGVSDPGERAGEESLLGVLSTVHILRHSDY